jgi:hypothetical protein
MDMLDRLESINRQLIQDPYQIHLLFEKILINVFCKNKETAKEILLTLHRLSGIEDQLSSLDSLLDGHKKLIFSNGKWFIMPADSNEGSCEQIIQCTHQHHLYLSSLYQRNTELLLIIELVPLPYSYLDHSIDNLAFIKLSGLENTLTQHSAALVHELTHVFLPCKNRVLSEGVALYIENKQVPTDSYVASVDDSNCFIDNYKGTIPSLSFLLSNVFKDDVFFENKTENSQEQELIYHLSFLVVTAFVEKKGIYKLEELIDKINLSEDEQALTVFQSFFNDEQLKLSQLLNKDYRIQSEVIEVKVVEDKLRADRIDYQCSAYNEYYLKLKGKATETSCATSKILLGRVLLGMFSYRAISRQDLELIALYEVEELAEQLGALGFSAEDAYFKARVEAIKLMNSENGIEKAIYCNRARSSYEVAIQKVTSIHPEACIDYAVFELYVPLEHGRNVGKATELLQLAEVDSRYVDEVQQIKQHFNI